MDVWTHHSTILCNSYSNECTSIALSRVETQKRGMAFSLLSVYNRSMRSSLFLSRCNDGMGFFITGSRFTIHQLFNVALSKLKFRMFGQISRLIYWLNLSSIHQGIKRFTANFQSIQNFLGIQQSFLAHSNQLSFVIAVGYTKYTTLTKYTSTGIINKGDNVYSEKRKIKKADTHQLNSFLAAYLLSESVQPPESRLRESRHLPSMMPYGNKSSQESCVNWPIDMRWWWRCIHE